MRTITLTEYESREAQLTRDEVTTLLREFSGKLDVVPTLVPDTYSLHAKQFVGHIVSRTCRITIKPKVPIGNLFRMLWVAYGLKEFRPQYMWLASLDSLFEFVVDLFTCEARRLITRGLLKDYVPLEENLNLVRGKILVAQTLQTNLGRKHLNYCEYSEFTADTVENQLLKLASVALLNRAYETEGLRQRLRQNVNSLARVSLRHHRPEVTDTIVFHRLNAHYKPVIDLCRFILDSCSVSGAFGDRRFYSFLVDMNKLFEHFVTKIIFKALEGNAEISAKKQHRTALDVGAHVDVQPDLVLLTAGRPSVVLDAKYKRLETEETRNTDVYQVLAYCKAFGCGLAGLIYPSWEGRGSSLVIRNSDIRIEHVLIDLGSEGPAFDAECRRFVNTVVNLATQQTESPPLRAGSYGQAGVAAGA